MEENVVLTMRDISKTFQVSKPYNMLILLSERERYTR